MNGERGEEKRTYRGRRRRGVSRGVEKKRRKSSYSRKSEEEPLERALFWQEGERI